MEFTDPDGLRLELLATLEPDSRTPASSTDIPVEFGIRGFHSTTLAPANSSATAALLTATMGCHRFAEANNRIRYTMADGGPGTYVDLVTDSTPSQGLSGAGTVHHVAFRVADDAMQVEAQQLLEAHGVAVSPVIDRAYFKSIYYHEPGGVLFEIATDQPGFAIDEPAETLGTRLSLPPRLEPHRAEIEAALPNLD